MNNKDVLINLINSVLTVDTVDNGEFIETFVNVEEIVEYLLANGVTLQKITT